eukprot:CAMPEP_0180045072 /NCGR_PEP_ID=MMETSP0984-20121128/36259_1 /TAXON_ID=483367 /ORGANISM="non described non described, Strain CCMP 2436" /LENGTH=104 /DNA_ID=CAMNT_0021973277 /DNA_START=191 /DNA_END=505 /DNA_ORIENTATION=+
MTAALALRGDATPAAREGAAWCALGGWDEAGPEPRGEPAPQCCCSSACACSRAASGACRGVGRALAGRQRRNGIAAMAMGAASSYTSSAVSASGAAAAEEGLLI